MVDQLESMILLKQHAKDYNVTVSEEEQEEIETAAKAFTEANDKATLEKLAVTQSDVETLLELYTYQNRMYEPMTADVDTNVEDSEAAQSKITYCKVDISDTLNEDGTTTPITDEEKQAKKAQAQAVLDKVKASGDVASADMDALAKEVDENLSAVDTDQEKESIVNQRKQETYSDLLEDWKKETKFTVDKKEWKKVKLTDNDQYTIKQPETTDSTNEDGETNTEAAE